MSIDINPLYAFYFSAAIAVVLVAETLYLVFADKQSYRGRVNRRLVELDKAKSAEIALVKLRRDRGLTDQGSFRLPYINLNRLILQSGVTIGFLQLAIVAIGIAIATFAGLFWVSNNFMIAAAGAISAGPALPLLVLSFLRNQRQRAFGTQFPEAIDVIVRSLRAGHPVPVAIATVAEEMPDPVGTEFGIASDEITFGTTIDEAMRNLVERVGQEDLPLFVTSVSIQASTGGNLSEILDNLAAVLRDRTKMRRKIRALSSEARTSALVLGLTPFLTFLLVHLIAPDFYGEVWGDERTTIGLVGAGTWMAIGVMIMRKMVRFRF